MDQTRMNVCEELGTCRGLMRGGYYLAFGIKLMRHLSHKKLFVIIPSGIGCPFSVPISILDLLLNHKLLCYLPTPVSPASL